MKQRLQHRRVGWLRLIVLSGIAASLVGGCSLFGGEEEEDPPADLVKFKSSIKIKKAWSSGLGDDGKNLRLSLDVATDGTNVYAAAHDGRVAAFEAIKGKRIWKKKTKLPLSAGPTFGEGILVLGSSNGDVIALNAADGTERWRTVVSSEVLAAPAVTQDLVLVRTVDGKLIALSIDTGGQAWFVQQSVPRLSVRGIGAPVVTKDSVVCGFDNGRIAAYEIGDGSLIWDLLLSPPSGRTEIDRLSDLNATVRVVGDDVFAVGYQGGLTALAVESGQVLWTREIPGHGGLGVDFNNLYVAGDASELSAVSRRTGRELWRHDILLNRDITGPTPYGSSIVVGDYDGYVHWFDARDGTLRARVRAGSDRITSAPLVVNDLLYVITDAGKLFAFTEVKKN